MGGFLNKDYTYLSICDVCFSNNLALDNCDLFKSTFIQISKNKQGITNILFK